jgi:hypothetical protein
MGYCGFKSLLVENVHGSKFTAIFNEFDDTSAITDRSRFLFAKFFTGLCSLKTKALYTGHAKRYSAQRRLENRLAECQVQILMSTFSNQTAAAAWFNALRQHTQPKCGLA